MIKPTNALEFQKFMIEIDSELKEKNIPVHGRPISAFRYICSTLQIDLMIAPIEKAIENNYEGSSFSAHILKWYDDIYGDNLKIDFSLAYVIVLIKRDPYKCKIPKLFGTISFILDDSMKKQPHMLVRKNGEPKEPFLFNVYELIEGLTIPQIKLLNITDKKELLHFFFNTFQSIYKLHNDNLFPFLVEANSDLNVAVDFILAKNTNYGLSKWSSLQFSEKVMKGLLKKNNIVFPQTHNLTKLNSILAENKIVQIPEEIISKINCSADVRYDKSIVDLRNAIESHHASLKLLAYCYK